eukprot:scaffold198204_cov17-Tisochrysis_lutea.AAC.1
MTGQFWLGLWRARWVVAACGRQFCVGLYKAGLFWLVEGRLCFTCTNPSAWLCLSHGGAGQGACRTTHVFLLRSAHKAQ